MPIHQKNNYTQLEIKENNFIDELKLKLNKTWILHTHKWRQTNIYIQTHTQKISRHTFTEKSDYEWKPKPLQHTHTHTHTQHIKYQK